MSLKVLPDVTFPLTASSIAPLADSMVQLNLIDGCLTDRDQRALGIHFHIFDLWVKSGGKYDYRGRVGHERLKQDAHAYARSESILTRYGDLAAAHLAIDFSDCQIRCQGAGLPLLPTKVQDILVGCIDLCGMTAMEEKRVSLILDILGKKSPI